MIRADTDKKWFNELVLELRIRQVYGKAIGDTVASARELLHDTGQSAEETFGPARDYAGALELPAEPRNDWVRAALWPTLLSLLAFLFFGHTAAAWVQSELLLLSPAQLALISAPAVLTVLMPLYLDALVRRTWLSIPLVVICVLTGGLSAVVAPSTRADAWLAIAPTPWLIASFLFMVLLSIMNTIRSRRAGSIDEITDPLSDASERTGLGLRVFVLVTNWLFPLFALISLGLSLALTLG